MFDPEFCAEIGYRPTEVGLHRRHLDSEQVGYFSLCPFVCLDQHHHLALTYGQGFQRREETRFDQRRS